MERLRKERAKIEARMIAARRTVVRLLHAKAEIEAEIARLDSLPSDVSQEDA